MNTSNTTVSRFLYSAVGIAAVGLLLVAINVIGSVLNARFDMTEEKRYTLSQGTRSILREMDAPVTIRFYFSRDVRDMPLWMRNYAPRVRDMLKEYELIARGGLTIEERNPAPDSDDEDSAVLDGIHGQMLPAGEPIYFGLGFSCLGETDVIPVLSPQDESMLEYEITRAIYRVLNPEKPTLGLMSGLPIMGRQPDMMMMMQQQQQGMRDRGTPPWYVIQDLKRHFEIRELPLASEAIDADIDILLLVHPKELSDETLFALDQFVLRGGRIVAFLDPLSYIEVAGHSGNPMHGPPPVQASTLEPLLTAWGVQFDPDRVLADLQYQLEWQAQNGQFQRDPFMLNIDRDAFNADDPTTASLDTALIGYAGAFSGAPVDGLHKTVLVQSSIDSALVDSAKASMSIPEVVGNLPSSGVKQAMAIRLTGVFPTAFPDGPPRFDEEDEAEDEAREPAFLTSGESAVVLVADSDMLHDAFCIRQVNLLGQTVVQPTSDNLAFFQNVVEHLAGDRNLLSVRSLGVKSRPFTTIQKIRAKAERQYLERISSLEAELSRINRELRELQQVKNPDQRFVLTPEQEAMLREAQRERTAAAQELKRVRREFRKDIDTLQARLKFVNIAAVPLAVALIGMSVAFVKRRRMAN